MSLVEERKTRRNPHPLRAVAKGVQEYLNSRGITLDITHGRPVGGLVVIDPDTGEEDSVLSRKEFTKVLKHEIDIIYSEGLTEDSCYGEFVLAHAGFTRVVLTTATGDTYKGKYNFGKNENFFKSRGIYFAIKAALDGTCILEGFGSSV
mgnify:CR=1 FL=1